MKEHELELKKMETALKEAKKNQQNLQEINVCVNLPYVIV